MTTIETIIKNRAAPDIGEFADEVLVEQIAYRMHAKLKKKRVQGYSGWWDDKQCSIETLKLALKKHLEKGDMIDVINFAAMIHLRELDISNTGKDHV